MRFFTLAFTLAAVAAALLPGRASAQSPVERHGLLYVCGVKVCDRYNKPVTLRGVSMFWSNWAPESYRRETVVSLKNDWEVDVVRVPIAVDNYGGPLGSSLKSDYAANLQLAKNAVNWAINQGTYVILDFHAHRKETDLAVRFFRDIARTFGNVPNLIYETWNEPCRDSSNCYYTWNRDIRPHHDTVIRAVQAEGAYPLFIVGTGNWSQKLVEAANDPLSFGKVLYTLHFYAGTGGADHEYLKGELDAAMNGYGSRKPIPVFVSEFGCTSNLGQTGWDWSRCISWLNKLNGRGVGHAVWSIAKPSQTGESGLLTDETNYADGIQVGEINSRGAQYRNYLKQRGGR